VATVAHVQNVDLVKIAVEIAVDAAETVADAAMIVVVVETIAEVAVKTATVVNQIADQHHRLLLQTMQCRSASKTNSTANLTVTN
jgi:environmental stress-induced protein Ves